MTTHQPLPFYLKTAQQQLSALTTQLIGLNEQFDDYLFTLHDMNNQETYNEQHQQQFVTQSHQYFRTKIDECDRYYEQLEETIIATINTLSVNVPSFSPTLHLAHNGDSSTTSHMSLLNRSLESQYYQLSFFIDNLEQQMTQIEDNFNLTAQNEGVDAANSQYIDIDISTSLKSTVFSRNIDIATTFTELPILDLNFLSESSSQSIHDSNQSSISPQQSHTNELRSRHSSLNASTTKTLKKSRQFTSSAVQQSIVDTLERSKQQMSDNVEKGSAAHHELVASSEILALIQQDSAKTNDAVKQAEFLTKKYEIKAIFNKHMVRWTFLFLMGICIWVVTRRVLWFLTPVVYANKAIFGIMKSIYATLSFFLSFIFGSLKDEL